MYSGRCLAERVCKSPDDCCVLCVYRIDCLKDKTACKYLGTTIPFGHAHLCDNFKDGECLGGNYCKFPAGMARKCCKDCDLVFNCPDEEGICLNLINRKK
jgi:hypothetical protein